MYDRRREAGQLVLVAAISIAFIVLGLVVVFNGVLYTQTVSSSGTSAALDDAETTNLEIEQGLEELVAQTGSPSETQVEAFVEAYAESKANQRPVVITVEDVDVTGSDVTVEYTYDSREVSGTFTAEV